MFPQHRTTFGFVGGLISSRQSYKFFLEVFKHLFITENAHDLSLLEPRSIYSVLGVRDGVVV